MLCVSEPLIQILPCAYIGLNIAVRLNLLQCASPHLTQLSDRFVRVLVTVGGQLALMLNVHILFSCGSCMIGIRSGAEREDQRSLPVQVRNIEFRIMKPQKTIYLCSIVTFQLCYISPIAPLFPNHMRLLRLLLHFYSLEIAA